MPENLSDPIPGTRPPGGLPCNANPADPLAQFKVLDDYLKRFPHLAALLKGPADPRDARTVAECVGMYLEDCRTRHESPRGLENKADVLNLFVRDFGPRPVAACLPVELKRWILARESWASDFTRKRANSCIQAVFNWCVAQRITRDNPFRGVSFSVEPTRREMSDAELQTILRASFPPFRRLVMALKLTGARPGELAALRFKDVDFNLGVAIVQDHKTRKKTGRPRLIALTAPALKLIRWLLTHEQDDMARAAQVLCGILKDGPVKAQEAMQIMRRHGFGYWATRRVRRRLGIICKRVGGFTTEGYTTYELPPGPVREPEAVDPERFVFVNRYGEPWTRCAISMYLATVRQRTGLAEGVTLYGLRRKFASNAIRSGVSLKVVSTLLGHVNTEITEKHYVNVDGLGDVDLLRQAAEQAAKAQPGKGGQP